MGWVPERIWSFLADIRTAQVSTCQEFHPDPNNPRSEAVYPGNRCVYGRVGSLGADGFFAANWETETICLAAARRSRRAV